MDEGPLNKGSYLLALLRVKNIVFYEREVIFMAIKKETILTMSTFLGYALSIGASLVLGKVSAEKQKEVIRKEVAKQIPR